MSKTTPYQLPGKNYALRGALPPTKPLREAL